MKNQISQLYYFGLKIVFMVAEYSGPTLFVSLMNLCLPKVVQVLSEYTRAFQSVTGGGDPAVFLRNYEMYNALRHKIIRYSSLSIRLYKMNWFDPGLMSKAPQACRA
ncbi:hypothetical protein HDF18_12390 [Mucilaginibacter sp. X5P1]|uniref:hypothetical protein n=1 Tax=Mucilaginibacter sp. X5P1 TaxID=2723088 RepID=UPI001620BECF|nr:hypothetical protein [Mucilaginibacter sp. X5P1]MBB6140380.1 hypothetical protein [Mucilaginibacter sp. X5P1]